MFRAYRLVTGAALLVVVLPATLAAQGHPNVAIGLSPEATYDSAGIDNISLFSGALSVGPIPLGPRYTVGPAFSYGLNALYNNNLWEFFPVEGTPYVEARPSIQFNLGAGWTVTLGELWHPGYVYNSTDDWIYVDPSGGRHKLYGRQFKDSPVTGGVRYARDNSFIRMKEFNGGSDWQRVETPDGLMRTFVKRGSRFRLEKIEDRFGNNNWVKICYGRAHCQNPDNPAADNYWRITDSHGRTTHVDLRTDLSWLGPTISVIDFPGPNGQRLVWTFDYREESRARSGKDTDPNTPSTLTMGLLVRINRPSSSKYEMLEDLDGDGVLDAAYWDGYGDGMLDRPGMLKRITLPTGGSIRYDYQRYDFPGSGYPPDYYQSATGVKTRKTYDRDGTLIGTTTYHTIRNVTTKEMETRVVQPTGECSRHFFEADPMPHTSTGAGWDYGLPYTRRFDSGGRFLSSKFYAGHSGGSCTGSPIRTTFVQFAHDPFPNLGGNPSNWYNTNRRLKATRTKFHDAGDRYVDTELSGYDGVGHYRTTTTTSNIGFTNDRIVTTNFNPGRSPWTPWPVGDPWILGTFNWTRAEEPGAIGGSTAKVEYQFNTNTGALTCQRVLKSGTSRSGADIVTQYKRNGAGNVWQMRMRGGDGAGLSTGTLCAGSDGAGANFQYTAGVRDKVRPIGDNGALLGYFTYDADIDPGTGWVMATRDPSGLQTSYSYDALGRVTQVTPQEGASSSTTYTDGTGSGPAKIRTTVTGAGTTLSDTEVIFDGLGRVERSRRRTPDYGWVVTYTKYDAAGRVLSRTLPNDPNKKVRYLDYDPFGRPGVIRPPEEGHDVQMTYSGPYNYTRSVKIGQAGGETYETWRYSYDGHGRLKIVVEPGAIAGQETGESLRAAYAYDVAGRLTQVRTVDGANGIEQERVFLYDNRGFLLQEQHPELGPSGSPAGHTSYSGYDALGNPGEVFHSSSNPSLRFQYDPFGRLTYVRDPATNQVIKRFIYDTAVGRGEGKLAQAIRHNRVVIPGRGEQNVKVTETFGYWGTAGALSVRTTEISRGGLEFVEHYHYDAAGQLIGQGYPTCGHAGCDFSDLPSRTVDFSYNLGHLRWVGGFTSGPVTYHPDSSWATIPHSNGVADHRDFKLNNPSRTKRLSTTGASSNYDTGVFWYDGAGHITQMGERNFLYDAVGRLVRTDFGVTIPEWEYEYDAFGNLKKHTQFDLAGFPTPRSFAINMQKNQLASGSATYDWRGNLLSWGGGSYSYDEVGNLQSVGSATVHLYSASDERVGTIFSLGAGYPVEETYTLRSAGGQVLREVARDDSMPVGELNWNQDYVWRGGQLLATVHPGQNNGFKRHYTLNHLGSPMLVTNWQANTVAQYDYAPFGEDMSSSNPPGPAKMPMRFTGHERDFLNPGTLDDLDYMHARHYTPHVGRFLQIDQVLGSPESPQSWNRYAYAANDPINFYDPDGREIRGQTHRVLGVGPRHGSIYIKPENAKYWANHPAFREKGYATIGAQRIGGLLVSGVNRDTDMNLDTKVQSELVDLGGRNEDLVILMLLIGDASYGDSLKYASHILGDTDGYNSNSFFAGLLAAVDLKLPDLEGILPGIDKPVPKEAFEAIINVVEEAVNAEIKRQETERSHYEWVEDVHRMYDTMCPSCNFRPIRFSWGCAMDITCERQAY